MVPIAVMMMMVPGSLTWEAESCSCGPRHPQTAYCESDIVLRAKFVSKSNTTDTDLLIRYEVKTMKVFKSPPNIKDVQYIYTPNHEAACGYIHRFNNKSEEFLIFGYIRDGKVHITLCSNITPWAKLSYSQIRGIKEVYGKNCDCKIQPCYAAPCEVTSDNQCLWSDPMRGRGSPMDNTLACVHSGRGICTWKSLKSNVYATAGKTNAK